MSATIDQRIVEMQFNNKDFERNVATSMSTLEKLKRALKFDGASKGLDDLQSSTKKFNFSGMTNGIDQVTAKFSYMQATIQHQINNIVDTAVNAGKRMVSALTVDPIKTGFQEYETQINAVQTILANTQSKGTTLDQVNQALDTLNTYADKTIYNFTEMTRNIGTFTAAGVDLDTSVSAIQGIANVAAVSGSTSQQASTAMYQLSQALATGTVKLMDWNSVVNAGMGGQVFQDALKQTSELLGTGAEAAIKAKGSFRESLQTGWLTSEVLTETLKKFTTSGANEYVAKYTGLSVEAVQAALDNAKAQYGEADAIEQASKALAEKSGKNKDEIESVLNMAKNAEDAATKVKTFSQLWDTLKEAAQSGWTQTWEILIGDFEEAKELLTSISDTVGDVINKISENRNTKLEAAMTSNWDKLVKKINEAGVETDTFEEKVKSIAKDNGYNVEDLIKKYGSLEKAFQEGAIKSSILKTAINELKTSFTDLSKVQGDLNFGSEGEDVKQVQKALQGLGYELGEFGADGKYGKATQEAVKAFQEANDLEITGIVDDATLSKLKELNESATDFGDTVYGLIDNIQEIGGRMHIIESLKNIFSALVDVIKPIGEAFREVFPESTWQSILKGTQTFHDFTEKLKVSDEVASKIKSTFKGLFSVISFVVDIVKAVGSGFISIVSSLFGFTGAILDGTGALGDWITKSIESAKQNNILVTGINKITEIITGAITKIKEFGSSLKENFKTPDVGGIFGFFKGLWSIITQVGSAVAKAFGSMGKTISEALGKGDIFEVLNSGLIAGIFLGIQKFTKSLGDVFDGAGGVLENVKGTLDDVRGCFKAYQEQLKAGALLKIASAIAILAAAIFVISTIDEDALAQSLMAITVLFGELIGSLAIFDKMGGKFKGAFKAIPLMIALSAAVLILAAAMKVLSGLDIEGLMKGLVGITGLVYILTEAAKKMDSNDKFITKFAGQMILMSAAIGILAVVAKELGSMSWEELAKSGAGILGITAILVLASKIMDSNDKAITKFAGQMILMSAAIGILAVVAKSLGSMSWDGLGKAGAGILGIVTLLVISAKIMDSNDKFITKFAGQMILMSAAIGILAVVAKELGSMSWEELAKAGVGLLGIVTLLVASAKIMNGKSAAITKFAGQMLLMSAAIVVLSIGLKKLGEMSVGSIVKSLVALAGAFAVIGIAGALLSPLIPAILGLTGAFALLGIGMVGIGAGLLMISAGITGLSVALASGATSIVAALTVIVTGILDLIPTIARIIGEGIVELAKVIGEYAPQLADSFFKLISETLKSLATYAPQITDSLLDFLIGVINSLANHTPQLIDAFVNLLSNVFKGVVDALNDADPDKLLKGIGAIGLMSALAYALAGVASIIPAAMGGLAGVGLLIAELSAVLAALGGLNQIPGLQWLVSEGGEFLATIGNALGKAIGSLIGGIGEGLTGSLPEIGQNIADFMDKLAIASDNASGIKAGSFDGVTDLVGALGSIGLTTVGTSISDIFTLGGTSMEKFQTDGVAFFNAMRAISNSATGIVMDQESMNSVITMATRLADLQASLEPIGGVISWFTGRDDLATFGTNAGQFIGSMKTAFESLGDASFNTEALTSIITGATKLADLQSSLEPIGGVVSWFSGRDDLGTFGVNVGIFISSISTAFSGLDGVTINTEVLSTIITAATKLSELQSSLEPIGGVISWFTGRDDLGTFGINVGQFISSMKMAFVGLEDVTINTEALGVIITASTKLSELQSSLEPIGGVISWFTGRDDLATFGVNVGQFISSMKTAFVGLEDVTINTEALTAIITASTTLAGLQSSLESVGGVVDWFTGRDDLATFGTNAGQFMSSMKTAFADLGDTVINQEAMNSIISAATSLAGLQSSLESVGGVVDWFTGRDDLGTFGTNIGTFAEAMGKLKTGMGEDGITEAVVTSITNAGNALIALNNALPEEGFFDSKITMDDFSDYITNFGTAISDFSDKASNINSEGINTAINAANRIKYLISSIANLDTSGVAEFTGVGTGGFGADGVAYNIAEAIAAFSEKVADINVSAVNTSVSAATKLKTLISSLVGLDTSGIENFKPESIGKNIKSYADAVGKIDTGIVSKSVSVAYRLKNFISSLSGLDNSGISSFKLKSIGTAIQDYSGAVAGIDVGQISSSISAANKLKSFISSLSGLDTSGVASFKSAVSSLAKVNLGDAAGSLSKSATKFSSVGTSMMESLSKGISSKTSGLKNTMSNLVSSLLNQINVKRPAFATAGSQLMAQLVRGISNQRTNVTAAAKICVSGASSAIKTQWSSFYSSGKYLGDGLVLGLNAKQSEAYNAGYALGQKSAQGVKDGAKEQSPSKLTIQYGKYLGEGLIIGINSMVTKAYKAGYRLSEETVGAMSSTIAKVAEYTNAGLEAEPTIRPIMDLSDIESGVGAINGMFGQQLSVGATANLSAIGAMMSRRNQNGTNTDVVSAIDKLRKDIGKVGGTSYNINGITYDDGSNLKEAVETIIRAATMERRV